MTWPSFIAAIESRALAHLPPGQRAAAADASTLDALDIFAPERDSQLTTLAALFAGRHPSPFFHQLTVRKARIRSWRPRRRAQVELVVDGAPAAYFAKLERP